MDDSVIWMDGWMDGHHTKPPPSQNGYSSITFFSNRPCCYRWLVRHSSTSPKQQRQPLTSLLSFFFFYNMYGQMLEKGGEYERKPWKYICLIIKNMHCIHLAFRKWNLNVQDITKTFLKLNNSKDNSNTPPCLQEFQIVFFFLQLMCIKRNEEVLTLRQKKCIK